MTIKRFAILAAILVLLDAIDSLTTYYGLSIGFVEANPYGNMILSFSPVLFYLGGTVLYLVLTRLMYLVYRDHFKLRTYMTVFMMLLLINKAIPVVWNSWMLWG